MSKKNPWDHRGDISIERAIMEGLFDEAIEVVARRGLDRMQLVYEGGFVGKALLHGADIEVVRDFIYDQRALHDKRLQLTDRIDENRLRRSVLDLKADGSAHTLDVMQGGEMICRIWMEQNVESLAMNGKVEIEFYVEPADNTQSSVQYNEGPRMGREPMAIIRPKRGEIILAIAREDKEESS